MTQEPAYDVVLTYAASEVMWASDVERALADARLNVFRIVTAEALDDAWEAHVESHALVVLLAPAAEPPLLMFEAGAAMMGQKPVFILYKGPRPSDLPSYLERFGVFRASEIDRVVDLASQAAKPLSEQHQQILIKQFSMLHLSFDQLKGDHDAADELTRRFNRAAKSSLNTERLMRELLRLRKHRSKGKTRKLRV